MQAIVAHVPVSPPPISPDLLAYSMLMATKIAPKPTTAPAPIMPLLEASPVNGTVLAEGVPPPMLLVGEAKPDEVDVRLL